MNYSVTAPSLSTTPVFLPLLSSDPLFAPYDPNTQLVPTITVVNTQSSDLGQRDWTIKITGGSPKFSGVTQEVSYQLIVTLHEATLALED